MFNKIKLMIIGAQKSGTTSLQNYLAQHPKICMNNRGEFVYFIDDHLYKLGYKKLFNFYFRNCSNSMSILSGKNVSILYSEKAIKRLKHHNPDVKIVILLRNPVDRAYSAYWYARRRGWENITSFEKALKAKSSRFKGDHIKIRNCAYLDRGFYYKHLKKVMKYFNNDQLLIFLYEDLVARPLDVCREIFKAVGVNIEFIPDFSKKYNTSAIPRSQFLTKLLRSRNQISKFLELIINDEVSYQLSSIIHKLNERKFIPPKMNLNSRNYLLNYFTPYNQKLSKLIKRDLSCWSN
jgi:hypothetical protein